LNGDGVVSSLSRPSFFSKLLGRLTLEDLNQVLWAVAWISHLPNLSLIQILLVIFLTCCVADDVPGTWSAAMSKL
jgi:hypothetical protein